MFQGQSKSNSERGKDKNVILMRRFEADPVARNDSFLKTVIGWLSKKEIKEHV